MTNDLKKHPQENIRKRGSGIAAYRVGMRGDTGQALVELALTFPIFLLLLVGAAEFGRLAYAAIEVSNAARAGASYGSLTHITASDYANIKLIATKDAANLTMATPTVTNVCQCSTGGTLVCTSALLSCPSPARIIEYVKVNTTATVGPLFHYPGLPHTFTVTGQAIMRVEQ